MNKFELWKVGWKAFFYDECFIILLKGLTCEYTTPYRSLNISLKKGLNEFIKA